MNPYQQYQAQAIYTMTREEILLRLYDELLKRLLRAERALGEKNYELFDQSITRCREIVVYLIDTLNFQYPISRELKRHYDFFIYELSRIASGRKMEVIHELRPLIEDLKNAFAAAAKKEGAGHPTVDSCGLLGKG